MDKNTVFSPGFWKKKNFKSLLLIHRLTVLAENLHKGTSKECKKYVGSGILNSSFFRYLQPKNLQKWWFSLFLELCCTLNSTKSKKSKMCFHQCAISSKMVKQWRKSSDLNAIFYILVTTLYFWFLSHSHGWPSNVNRIWTVAS